MADHNESTSKTSIEGLEIGAVIGRGAHSVVYSATRAGERYAVKVLHSADAAQAHDETIRFRREASILARLRSECVAQVMALGELDSKPCIVMEYIQGTTLALVLAERGRLSERDALKIATKLCSGLDEVHRLGLVHQDLKPQNMLVDDELDHLKLIDFGLAVRATDRAANTSVGTFLYSPPEQTGMLRRPVDCRSDLYSLGAVLYECVAGRPVFQSKDTTDLIRKHGMEIPEELCALVPTITPAFSAIVMKLLAKDPDDRYQTALGLQQDLLRIDALNVQHSQTHSLLLAHEQGVDTNREMPLIGRDKEVKTLLELWRSASAGRGCVALIEGEPGSGKTRLINEVIGTATRERALVLRAKCIEGDPMAFNPMRTSLLGLVREIETMSDAERGEALAKIRVCAEGSAVVIARFAPALAKMLGLSVEAGAFELGQDQVSQLIADLYVSLGKAFGGLLLFIDDVQWLDDATRKVLERLTTQIDKSHLFFAAVSRNDPASTASLERFAREHRGAIRTRISLGMLSVDAVSELIAAYLRTDHPDARLVELVFQRSHGSPFALGEYLRALLEGGFLRFAWGHWLLQEGDLHQISLPTDVLQLVVGRIDNLDRTTVEVLRFAACMGAHFKTESLKKVTRLESSSINAAIEEATTSRLIEHVLAEEYSFIHDRVREALLQPLSDSDRAILHAKLAAAMDEAGGDSPNLLYELARHYTLGIPSSPVDRVYATNLAAGSRALSDAANEEAFTFLDQAERVNPVAAKRDMRLQECLGEACLRTKRDRAAIEHFQSAIAVASASIKRAQLRTQLLKCYISTEQHGQISNELNQALAEVGHPIVKETLGRLLSYFVRHLWLRMLHGLGLKKIVKPSAGVINERAEILTHLHQMLAYVGFQFSRPLLTLQGCLGEYYFGTQAGSVHSLELAYSGYFVLLAILNRPKGFERIRDKCFQTCEAYGDRSGYAQSNFYNTLGYEVLDNPNAGLANARSLQTLVRWMDAADALQSYLALLSALAVRGLAAETIEAYDAQRAHLGVGRSEPKADSNQNVSVAAFAKALTGASDQARDYLRQGDEFSNRVNTPFLRTVYCANALMTHWELGTKWQELKPLADLFENHVKTPPMMVVYAAKQFYVARAFILLRELRAAKESAERADLEKQFRRSVWQLRLAAANSQMMSQYLCVIRGDYLAWKHRYDAASRFFDRAQKYALSTNSPLVVYELSIRRARMNIERGKTDEAQLDIGAAHDLAARHGWVRRSRSLEEEFSIGSSRSIKSHAGSSSGSQTTAISSDTVRLGRHLDALLGVSLASSNVFDALAQSRNVLDEMVRLLSAERAFLFVADENTQLQFFAGRDKDRKDISVAGHSKTVIAKVLSAGRPIVVSSTADGVILGSESVVAYDLRSIIAAPLMLKDKLYGVIYMDSSLAQGVFTEEDIGILTALANHIAIALETARGAKLELERQALAKDLALTAAVQALLLPQHNSATTPTFSVAGYSRSAAQSGGDWWWMDEHNGRTRIVVGDVTGHGAGSAMVTAVMAGCYQTLRQLHPEWDGAMITSEMNRVLFGLESEYYRMTLIVVEVEGRDVRIWSAGAPPVLVVSDDRCQPLSVRGTPLGTKDFLAGTIAHKLEVGDSLAIFTDGLFEMKMANERLLGLRGVQKILQTSKSLTPPALCQEIAKQVDVANAKFALDDDVTFVYATAT